MGKVDRLYRPDSSMSQEIERLKGKEKNWLASKKSLQPEARPKSRVKSRAFLEGKRIPSHLP